MLHFQSPASTTSQEFPVNGPPGPPSHDSQRGSYGERCLSPEPSSTCKSPVNEPPFRLPIGAPMEKDACPLSPLPHILLDPQQRSPPSRFPLQSSHRERCSLSGALLQLSQKVNGPPPPKFPNRAPTERSLFPEISYTPPLISPVKEPPPPCFPTGFLWREMLSLRSQWFILHLHPSESSVKEPSHFLLVGQIFFSLFSYCKLLRCFHCFCSVSRLLNHTLLLISNYYF